MSELLEKPSQEEGDGHIRGSSPPKVLAISSGGGHWVQLLRIAPALGGEVVFACVEPGYAQEVAGHRFHRLPDATRWNKFGLIKLALRVLWLLLRERPRVIISTGAAPGYLALRMGKWFGARTIWLDSMANVETLSMSGRRVGPYADLWLTQWPHLARPGGPQFRGAVL